MVHETNKAHFRNVLPNRFLASSVSRVLDWWYGGCGFNPQYGQLFYFALFRQWWQDTATIWQEIVNYRKTRIRLKLFTQPVDCFVMISLTCTCNISYELLTSINICRPSQFFIFILFRTHENARSHSITVYWGLQLVTKAAIDLQYSAPSTMSKTDLGMSEKTNSLLPLISISQ